MKAAFQKARDEFGGVDVCVNNAGLAHNAPLLSGATSDWKNMLDVSHVILLLQSASQCHHCRLMFLDYVSAQGSS